MTPTPIFVCDKPWGQAVLDVVPSAVIYDSHRDPRLDGVNASRAIYFPHYSKIVEPKFLRKHRCVGFHLGSARGGSPLQWERLNSETDTLITMFRMTSKLDAGKALGISNVCIAGAAEEAYVRMIKKAALMAVWFEARMLPKPTGKSLRQLARAPIRRRREPSESELRDVSLDDVADFIQMLDAKGYPHAFFERDGLRFEFTRAVRRADSVVADVRITVA